LASGRAINCDCNQLVEAFMTRLVARLSSVSSSFLVLSMVVALAGGCAPDSVEHLEARSRAVTAGANPGNLDILFMIDNSSSMTELQQKMLEQDPSFMKVLQDLPNGLPNIHVAVVSSDMGAPGDSTSSIMCTRTGDNGVFQSTARGTCTDTTLSPGATFISNVGGQANYTGSLTDVFGCIAQLGDRGCGFESQLASVARALGADGAPPPSQNANFLRPDAELAIIVLTNEDDCSAPANTTVYSLNGGQQNIANPLGPIANYRCNQFGHLCIDPASATPGAFVAPPIKPPTDAQGTTANPTLNMTSCQSNDTGTGLLTSVAAFVAGIRALKPDPDNQIVVGAIAAPPTPYTVAWFPQSGGQNTQPGELWPAIEHSCGAVGGDNVNPLATMNPTDGSFGDPAVRVAQWVHAFGDNGVVTSICDPDYSVAFQTIANKINLHLQAAGTGGAGGAGGIIGGVGGHANVGGSSGAAGAGGAGGGGPGTGGAAGSGGSGIAGNTGSNTGGTGVSGAGGNSATGGHAGTGGQPATGGVSGAAGTGGNAVAGASGTGTGGSSVAGASGSGTGGAGGGGATTGTGTGGAAGAGSIGTGGSDTAGASGGPGAGGAAGHGQAGNGTGAAGTGGTGGTTEGGSSGGCSCETGGASPSGLGWTMLLGALVLLAKRKRGDASVTASSAAAGGR
jgi:MYXO-CTERM domain-containing protein